MNVKSDTPENTTRKRPRQSLSPHDLQATIISLEHELSGQVKDLSLIGIGILLPQPDPELSPGQRVEVDLSTSLDSAPLRLTAEVVQVTPLLQQADARLLIGLSFVEMSDSREQQLESFLIVVEEAEREHSDEQGTQG